MRAVAASGSRVRAARAGFTLIEVLVVIGILAILAAIILVPMQRRQREAEATALARTLDAVAEAVMEYRTDVRRYPPTLTLLTTAPTVANTDLCGRTLPASFVANWRGPYLERSVTATGLRVGDATALDALEKEPATFTTSTVGNLLIVVQDVDSAAAVRMEETLESGATDLGAGTVRWTAGAGAMGTLRFAIPIKGC